MYRDMAERCTHQQSLLPGQTRQAQPTLPPSVNGQPHRDHLAKKADTAMHEDDDDDRIEAAKQLARFDPRAATEIFQGIACDDGVHDEYRIDAAAELARLDPRAAAEAFRSVSDD
jgi:hypothetical protein